MRSTVTDRGQTGGRRWEKPLTIDTSATTTAATINTKSNGDRKRIAKKLRIFLIISPHLRPTFESILNPIDESRPYRQVPEGGQRRQGFNSA